MGCQIVKGRKLNLPEGHSLIRSVQVDGEAYFEDESQLMLDYIQNGVETYVWVRKKTPDSSEWGKPKKWALSQVQDRTAQGLTDYAKRLGLTQQPPAARLAKLIEGAYTATANAKQ